jgi:hypothetical protein
MLTCFRRRTSLTLARAEASHSHSHVPHILACTRSCHIHSQMSQWHIHSHVSHAGVTHTRTCHIHWHVSQTHARVTYTRRSYHPIHARQPLGAQHAEQEARLRRHAFNHEHGARRKLKDHVQRCGSFRVCQRSI